MFINLITGFFLSKILIIAIDIVAIFLAFIVYRDNPRAKLNKIYLWTTIFMLGWVNFAYIPRVLSQDYYNFGLISLKIAWFVTPLFFTFLYLLTLNLIGKEIKYKLLTKLVVIIGLILSFITGFSDLIIAGFQKIDDILSIIYGSLMIPFLIGITFIIIAILWLLFKDKIIFKDEKIQFFSLGLFIFFISNIIFNILLPIFFGNARFYFFGDYSTLIILGFTAYAIIKYQLFNIKIIITELLVFAVWIFLLFRLLLSETIKDWFINGSLLALIVVFGILLIRSVMKEVKQREELECLANELKAANQKLLEIDKLKTGMFSFVSHQIKTPMAVIKGFSQLLYENSYGDLPQKAKETVGHIKDACDRLINLTNDFLDLRKIEEGKMDYQFTEINIVDLVKSVIDDLRLPAQNKGLEIIFEEPKDAKIMIKADEQRLRQVIQNLIDNSIKYTEKGWIKISLELTVDNQQQKNVIIKVADSGIGISKESLPNLFDEFVRAKETRTIKGTGLGLYIAKQIIEAHQGEIWAESEGEGKGSQFYVKLKAVE